jgi:hypothetical protein
MGGGRNVTMVRGSGNVAVVEQHVAEDASATVFFRLVISRILLTTIIQSSNRGR